MLSRFIKPEAIRWYRKWLSTFSLLYTTFYNY